MEAAQVTTDAPAPQAVEPQAPEGTQPEAPQVPDEITQRLDELGSRLDTIEPLLSEEDFEPEPDFNETPYGQPGYQPDPSQGPQYGFDPQTGQVVPMGQPEPQWGIDPQTGQPVPLMPEPDPEQIVDQRVQQAVGPLAEQLQRMTEERTNERLDALVEEFPGLQNETEREALVQDVFAFAAQSVEGLPPEHAGQVFERLRTNPEVVRKVYLARSAGQAAAQGAPGGDQGAVLEGGSGANPQPSGEEVPVPQQILAAGNSGRIV